MKKLKKRILFTLASTVDFLNKTEGYVYHNYQFLYDRIKDYQESSIREATLKLVETQDVDKITRNSIPLFRLTSRGRDRLLSFIPQSIGQKKVWDNIWRLAIFTEEITSSINKEKKEAINLFSQLRTLRNGLIKLGFRKLSRGIYLTPMPISAKLREFINKHNFTNFIIIIESRKLLVGDNLQLARQVWQLDDLHQKYVLFITQVKRVISDFKQQKRLTIKEKKLLSQVYKSYYLLLENDPGLPRKLLAGDWLAETAKIQFLRLTEKINFQQNI